VSALGAGGVSALRAGGVSALRAGGVSALGVDADDLAKCVACGLCLAHCPTFRVSGEEGLSPRGRIAAIRAVDAGAAVDGAFEHMMQTCVQCRACETACPSAVPFGRLMEATRVALAPSTVPWWQRRAYGLLSHHRLLVALTAVGGAAQRAHLVSSSLARRLALPRMPLRQEPLRPTGDDVWLYTGCVMDAWQRPVHAAAIAVLGAMGVGVALPGRGAGCCGALHVHAGLRSAAERLAARNLDAFPGGAPILVDSAGCGAALKDYGHLLGTAAAREFSARVLDIHEWMAARPDRLPAPSAAGRDRDRPRVAVQDPCHLRHVQRAEASVRTVLAPYADLVEIPDDGRCCGAGGAYSALQPELANAIRAQKLAAIGSTGAEIVASANPGCIQWLAAAGVPVRHPVEIVAVAAGLRTGTA
jgi:glycolate oxidase iron-sulfur subunit